MVSSVVSSVGLKLSNYLYFDKRINIFVSIGTGAISLFQAKVFGFNEIKTPQTEENLLYKMAQTLFSASRADFEFYPFYTVFTVFQAKIRGFNDFSKDKSRFFVKFV